ncbi:hypothetical protein NQ318_019169 [Aromia moschata]|uniref:Uncharacterized protein n=1 Tax=Aromia moschata TaxID=1265417 RepID=A0AAV8YRD6_9CUCU|nr:hypothetical protein NQ318_019169 [Aromia moschata]
MNQDRCVIVSPINDAVVKRHTASKASEIDVLAQQQQQQHQDQAQPSPAQQQPQQRSTTPVVVAADHADSSQKADASEHVADAAAKQPPLQPTPPPARTPVVQRAVSLPAAQPPERARPPPQRPVGYSQSERLPNRPPLNRSMSRREIIKNYIKKETATFFGVDEENENEQQLRWLDRRKRMASRSPDVEHSTAYSAFWRRTDMRP